MYGGAFDSFEGVHCTTILCPFEKYNTYVGVYDSLGTAISEFTKQFTRFLIRGIRYSGGNAPSPPQAEPWNSIEKLEHEVEVAGIYLSAHPLDDFKHEVKYATSCTLDALPRYQKDETNGIKLRLAGVISNVQHKTNKAGEGYASFTLQDYHGNFAFNANKELYRNKRNLLEPGVSILVEGTYGKDTLAQQR
ncbi:MAG: hypothetical protein IPF46_00595 [Saprospiraceae bacterium]|nr:hypothetical protein [Candidatus Vicinibacter affinis]